MGSASFVESPIYQVCSEEGGWDLEEGPRLGFRGYIGMNGKENGNYYSIVGHILGL